MQDGRRSIQVTATKTITDNEAGQVQLVAPTALNSTVTLTLPAAAAGKTVTVKVLGRVPNGQGPVGAGSGKSVALAFVGSVTGLGATGALTLSQTNQRASDEVTLVAGAATWYVQEARGLWAVA